MSGAGLPAAGAVAAEAGHPLAVAAGAVHPLAVDPAVMEHPPADPMDLALKWLPANDSADRPQITLATLDADGAPDARTVLLSDAGPEGFSFHTDALSRKVTQLAADGRVAITVLWPSFTRQLIIAGVAEIASPESIAAAFIRRSPYLQQLAWQNTADFAQLPLAERHGRWAAFLAEHVDGFDQPSNWTGFLVRPHRLTFWTSDPDAASRRLEYVRGTDGWSLSLLPG